MSTRPRVPAMLATGVLMCRAAVSVAQTPTLPLRDVLTRELGLSAADLAAVSRGEIVVRALPTDDPRDVAVIGVVRADQARRASLLMPRGGTHVFARPASLADVEGVRFTRDDIDELRQCRPSACNFKLPASGMEALRATIDSGAADVADRATAYVRQRILDYVNAYRERGNAAMVVYDDRGSVPSSAAFDAMIRDWTRLFRMVPALARYVSAYPRDTLRGATSTVLWSVDAMPRLRPVLRIMHHVVYTPPDDPGTMFMVAKQLYANHYFEAGLEALLFTDAAKAGFEGAGGDAVVVATRHYRFDQLPSGGPLDLRGRVVGGLQSAVVNDLRKLRDDPSRTSPNER